MHSRQAIPVGSNMNDLSYPFRGDYKLPQTLNHGHGGTQKVRPTSIGLVVSGSDLTVEEIDVPAQCKLDCEIGCGATRSHFVPQAVAIPNDGREYTLLSTVTGTNNAKHYCKLRLRGANGASPIVLDTAGCDAMTMMCDGAPVAPGPRGELHIPRNSKRCSLRPTVNHDRSVSVVCGDPDIVGSVAVDGVDYELRGSVGVEVPATRGPLQLNVRSLAAGHRAASPAAPAAKAPEITVSIFMEGGESVVTVHVIGASSSTTRLEIDSGAQKAAGAGTCSLRLDAKMSHRVSIQAVSNAGESLLRQTVSVPQLEHAPVQVSVEDMAGGVKRITSTATATLCVNGTGSFPGSQGCQVSPGQTQVVGVKQAGGGEATITFRDAAADQLRWITDLAAALDGPKTDEDIARAIAQVRPPTKEAGKIVSSLLDLYSRPKPSILINQSSPDTVAVSCPGFALSAVHGTQPPFVLPPQGGALKITPGEPLTLTALSQASGTSAGSCKLTVARAAPEPAAAALEAFMRGLLDAFQRHPAQNKETAAAIQRLPVDGVPFAAQMVPLLVDALNMAASPTTEDLVPRLLHAFHAAPPGDNAAVAQNVGQIHPQTDAGRQLLPLIINALHASLGHIPLSLGDVPATVSLFAAVDAATPSPILPTTGLYLPKTAQRVALSAHVTDSGARMPRSIVPDIVGIHARESDPQRRHAQWQQLVPPTNDEHELLKILLDLSARQMQRRAPSIEFVAGEGCLQSIRCDNFDLFASVDSMARVPVAQGSQVPRGTAFAEGSSHVVTLYACDRAGDVVAATAVTVVGGSGSRSRGVNTGFSFVDVELTLSRVEAVVTMSCPSQFRLSYSIDGVHSDNVGSTLSAKIDPQRAHKLLIRALDASGEVVFQQKLNIPRFGHDAMRVGLQDNKLMVEPVPGIVTTASINGSPERVVEETTFQLSPDTPNRVVLRQFVSDPSSLKVGELSLNLQQFIDPEDVKALIRIYQVFDRNFPALTAHLMQLHATAHSALMRQLVGVLASRAHDNMQNERWQEYFDAVLRAIKEMSFNAPPSRTYFFRLKGEA